MLVIEQIFNDSPTIRKVARATGLEPETVSRIIHGKQKPSFAEGGSAHLIASALGWKGDVRELFEEAGE